MKITSNSRSLTGRDREKISMMLGTMLAWRAKAAMWTFAFWAILLIWSRFQ